MRRPATAVLAAILMLLFLHIATSRSGALAQQPPPAPDVPPPPRTAVIIQLQEPAAVELLAQSRARLGEEAAAALAQQQIQRNTQSQQQILAADALAGAPLLFRTQRVYNGIALHLTPAQIAAAEKLPGVRAVHPLPAQEPMLLRTIPYLGLPAVWEEIYADIPASESVSIGVIDTGVDYLHVHFGGPGRGYAQNDPTSISDQPGGVSFPTAKVVGGYDFAGDNYSASPGGDPIPQPDPDPMDCWGHGTHVAGIAAGVGVLRNGKAYTGTYGAQFDPAQFLIGPGVAPRSQIYSLKIFGCRGSSNLTVQALEWAVDPNGDGNFSDRLDVLNMSIGSRYGSPEDPTVAATNNAALAGIVVVAAAGNEGDSYYITSAPGVADRAISVAATSIVVLRTGSRHTQDESSQLDGSVSFVDVAAPFSSRGPRRGDAALKPDIAAPGSSIGSSALGTGSGKATFSGTSMATPHIAGLAALLRAQHPGWTPEELKAALLNTARYNVLASGSLPPVLYGAGRAGAGRVVPRYALQTDVLLYNTADPGQVSLSFGRPSILGQTSALKNVRLVNKGAITRNLYLRYSPVVDMPGVEISLPAQRVSLTPFNSLNLAVLARATASDLAYQPDPTVDRVLQFPRHWLSEETGYLYAWPTANTLSAELTGDQQRPPVASSLTGTSAFLFTPETNVLSYTLTVRSTEPFTLAGVGLHAGLMGVRGPELRPLVTETISATQFVHARGAITLTLEQADLLSADFLYLNISTEAQPQGEIRGQLRLAELPIRLPVYVSPRPVSAMRAQEPVLAFGSAPTGTGTIALVGQGLLSAGSLSASVFPTDTVSIASAFELQFSSPNEAATKGIQEHADLRYVGIASDIQATATAARPDGQAEEARLLFALNTYGEWSTPNEVEFSILVDTDEDGATDYRIYTSNYQNFLGSSNSDEFFSVVENLQTGRAELAYFLNLVSAGELKTGIYDNSILLLAVDARQLGLSDANSDFAYRVRSQSFDSETPGAVLDITPWLVYDVRRPGLDATANGIGGFPIFYDLPGQTIPVRYDRDAFAANRSDGLLLLHHHNELPGKAEVIRVQNEFRINLPLVDAGE